MRVIFRGYGNGKLRFEEHLEIEESEINALVPALAMRHTDALPRKHMVEIEFPDDPNPAERLYRIGTDWTMMDNPQRFLAKQPVRIICAMADSPRSVPGTRFDLECALCHRKVMLAPSGQRRLREYPHAEIVCEACFQPEEFDVIEPAGTGEEICDEVRQARPNLRRNRN